MRFFKTAAIILGTLAGSFGAAQLASGTPLSAGALPLSENIEMSMISKSRWRGGGYRGYRGGYRGYRGGYRGYRGGYRGYRGGYRGYRGVRAYGYRYGYRPYRRYGAVGAVAGMAAAGLIHTTTHIRAFVARLAGIMAHVASIAHGSTVAGDTPTGGIAAATVAVCTGDGRSPCGAGRPGIRPRPKIGSVCFHGQVTGVTRETVLGPQNRLLVHSGGLCSTGRHTWL